MRRCYFFVNDNVVKSVHMHSGTGTAISDKAASRFGWLVRCNGISGFGGCAGLFWGDKIMVRSPVTTKVRQTRVTYRGYNMGRTN